jgi:hypothetical protein
MDPSDFSVEQKAQKKFGIFPYELSPTKDYLFALYQFYQEEKELCESFSTIELKNIKNLGELLGFQNYHTCVQSITFIKDWIKKSLDYSEQEFESNWIQWQKSPPSEVKAELEMEKVYQEHLQKVSSKFNESQLLSLFQEVFELYDECKSHPEECYQEPPHPIQFLQNRLEFQNEMKKLRKSVKKSNHPLASTFSTSLYGKYLNVLEDSFPVELKTPLLNLSIIYAFRNKKVDTTNQPIQPQPVPK